MRLFFQKSKCKKDRHRQEELNTSRGVEWVKSSKVTEEIEYMSKFMVNGKRYVFSRPKSAIYVFLIPFCLFMLMVFSYMVAISMGVLSYSKQFDFAAFYTIKRALVMIFLNIIVIVGIIAKLRFNKRYDIYLNVLRFESIKLIEELARYANVSRSTVIKDLKFAVKRKWIPQGHFVQNDNIFIISDKVYQAYEEKQTVYDRYYEDVYEGILQRKSFL